MIAAPWAMSRGMQVKVPTAPKLGVLGHGSQALADFFFLRRAPYRTNTSPQCLNQPIGKGCDRRAWVAEGYFSASSGAQRPRRHDDDNPGTNLNVDDFARCSLLVARCSLLLAPCSLLLARCSLLGVRWPMTAAAECAVWLREVLR